MKKVSLFLFVLLLGVAVKGMSQAPAAPAEYFAGKWEISILGTPNGDAKLVANLVRKDGKLTGNLTNPAEPTAEAIPITSIDESGEKLGLAFSAQGYDVTMELNKVDDDNLKGKLLNMFDATAKRLK